jgi:hypothetical protein
VEIVPLESPAGSPGATPLPREENARRMRELFEGMKLVGRDVEKAR